MFQQLLARGRRLLHLSPRQVASALKTPSPLSTNLAGFQGSVEIVRVPPFRVAAVALAQVRVCNTGAEPWPAQGLQAVSLGYRWRRSDDLAYASADDGHRSPLPRSLYPGAEVEMICAVKAPGTFGRYELELDLFRNLAGWFGQGGESARRAALVEGLCPEDIDPGFDYLACYRQADLSKDHWSVVGPRSLAEFQQLGLAKLRFLQEQGLTPSSRVLDVGCGTGQLAEPLLDYLSDEGGYVGTDVAPEAIAFCRQKYRRPNFRFLQNDMTGLPVSGETFDVIYLGSVWTHMYPEEIAAQLGELKRLLHPQGFLVADAFHSPQVRDHTPSRGMVAINESKLWGIFSDSGLSWTRVQSHAYNSLTARTIFRLEFGR